MNLLIFKDITDNSSEMQAAKNVLTQTLHLDYNVTDIANLKKLHNDELIDALFALCKKICQPLFYKDSFQFFGSDMGNPLQIKYRDLSSSSQFWNSAIKYHCVISTLFTDRHFLLKESKISAYHLNTYARKLGYFQLKELGYINEQHLFCEYNKENKSSDASKKLSDFNKLFASFYNRLSEEERQIFNLDSKKHFSLENSDFCYRLFCNRKIYNKLRKFYSNHDCLVNCIDFFDNSGSFFNSFIENSDHIVDEILLQYQLERYFNLSLTTETLNLIFSKPELLPPTSIPPEIIVSCFNLPNVFSRKLFLNFAFDSYHNKFLTENIFYKRTQDTGPVYFTDAPTIQTNKLILWLDLYKKFTYFFSHLVFPIYEKCFFLLYKDSIKSFNKPLITDLEQYISVHSDDILNGGFTDDNLRTRLSDPLPSITNPIVLDPRVIENKNYLLRCNLLLQDILSAQNNIMHPTGFPDLTEAYFGCLPGTSYHRKLMTLYVNSTLNNF